MLPSNRVNGLNFTFSLNSFLYDELVSKNKKYKEIIVFLFTQNPFGSCTGVNVSITNNYQVLFQVMATAKAIRERLKHSNH